MNLKQAKARSVEFNLPPKELKAAWAKAAAFKRWCAEHIRTVNGQPLILEPFQLLALVPYFAGVTETLLVEPKGQGKTTKLAALTVYHLSNYPEPPEAYIGASIKPQARKLWTEAARMASQLERDAFSEPVVDRLKSHWKDGKACLYNSPGYLDIRCVKDETEGFARVLSSDKAGIGSLEGIGPTLGLVDELHAHYNDALYRAIHGALHKRDGQMITISTAGADPEGTLGQIRAAALAMPKVKREDALTIAASRDFVMLEWSCKPTADLDDIEVVKQANPAKFVSKAKLKKLKNSPSMTESAWARYHCNVWMESDHAWLPTGAWQACGQSGVMPEEGEAVHLAVNFTPRIAAKHAALVWLWERDGKPYTRADIFTPPDKGPVRHRVVLEAVLEAHHGFQVISCAYDEKQFHDAASALDEEGVPMQPVKMTPSVWVPLTDDLMEAITTKRIVHDGDPAFAAHVNAGELRDAPAGQMLTGVTTAHCEALIGLGMAYREWSSGEGESVYSTRGALTFG